MSHTPKAETERWWVISDALVREVLADVERGLSPQLAYAKLEEWSYQDEEEPDLRVDDRS